MHQRLNFFLGKARVLLNRVASNRALTAGGRPSVSALLVELVRRHEKELRKELKAAADLD